MKSKLSLLVSGALLLCSYSVSAADTVRIAMVKTPEYSGLMAHLSQQFTQQTGIEVELHSSGSPHQRGVQGQADLVLSHYGKSGMEKFVMDGLGHWPTMVFANQAAIIGPKNDPVGIRGLSAPEAYKKLAASDAKFVANQLPGPKFIDAYLHAETGVAEPLSKRSDNKAAKKRAAKVAEQQQAYFIWGAIPFLRYADQTDSKLDILVADGALLHRVMATSVVRADKVNGVNEALAKQFEAFLIRPDTQAQIAAYRSMGSDRQLWWPYGRHN
ncbi:substrate-binding domain-containing protein [Ferrimonas senticii]|uniref:substrate-binding domain-containing protein n=1 Tax=Ferrimonas senticii TaxID=394566 RepID=UPI0003F6B9C5|nr:substrate-binding domain-containing protein [Ferrimonas senticii]